MIRENWKSLPRRVRWIANSLAGRDVWYRRQVDCNRVRLGSAYGGWTICPDDLNPDSVVYCVGTGYDISFDLELIRRYGVTVHAFDPTPVAIKTLEGQTLPAAFKFHPWGLAAFDGVAKFAPPLVEGYESFSIADEGNPSDSKMIELDVRRISTIMKDLGHDHVDLLKIDIEGAEYDVITDILSSGVLVRQFLVEFHHRPGGISKEKTRHAVDSLKRANFEIFDISAIGREYAFIRPKSDAPMATPALK